MISICQRKRVSVVSLMVFNNLTFRKILWCLLFNLTKCVFISPRIWMHWSTLANKPNYVWFNKNYLCNNFTWFDNIKISMVLDCYKFLGGFCNKSVKKKQKNKYQLNFAFSAGIFPYVQECLFAIAVLAVGVRAPVGVPRWHEHSSESMCNLLVELNWLRWD